MLIYIPCGHIAELDDLDANFCQYDGEKVTGIEWKGKSWNENLPEAGILHWLAQSQRREKVPLDSSEGVGLIAFEYAWKVFNQIYDSFGPPRSKAMGKMNRCLREYLDANEFVRRNDELLNKLCHYLLKDDDNLNEEFERIVIAFDCEPEERERILNKVKGNCQVIRSSIKSGDSFVVVLEMVRALYALRNARIHGHRETVSGFRPRQGPPPKPPQPSNEFITILSLMRGLDVSLLAGKLRIPEMDINELIMSRTLQLMREIRKSFHRVEGIDRVTFTGE